MSSAVEHDPDKLEKSQSKSISVLPFGGGCLLGVRERPELDCGEVNALLDEHIGHVAQRIKELRGLERQLKELRSSCLASQSTENCGILNGLAREGVAPVKSRAGAGEHVHGSHGKH